MSNDTRMTLLEAVRLVNTGVLLWNVVGPLLQGAMENGEDTVSLDDVEAASAEAGQDLDALRASIERAKAEGR